MENKVKVQKDKYNLNDATLVDVWPRCLTLMGVVENYPFVNLLIRVNLSAFFCSRSRWRCQSKCKKIYVFVQLFKNRLIFCTHQQNK